MTGIYRQHCHWCQIDTDHHEHNQILQCSRCGNTTTEIEHKFQLLKQFALLIITITIILAIIGIAKG